MRSSRSFGVVLVAAAAVLLAPAVARAADEPPPLPPLAPSAAIPAATADLDHVYLRNGALYRGHVSEIIPGDHVTIVVVEGGETKRVSWSDVDRVIVGSPAAPTPAGPPIYRGAPATPPLPSPMIGPRARVHLSSPRNTILYRRAAGSAGWMIACTSPCNEELPIGDTYRVTGNGIAQSKEFRLDAPPGGSVDVTIDPPSTGGMVLGGLMAGGGATAAYVGLALFLVGTRSEACTYDFYGASCTPVDRDSLQTAGLITLGVGSVLTAAGLLVFLNNAKTDISQSSAKGGASGAAGSAAGAVASPKLDAYLRRPTWRDALSSSERATAAAPASFPVVLGGSF